MELQFQKTGITCLETLKREWQTQEQTQEVKLSDGMPDIGSILCARGQVILRAKQWQPGGVSISGGTMVWVQYLPEGGGEAQCVECWIPFSLRWSFPQDPQDGKILAQSLLKSLDARSVSARKLMVRANVSVLAQCLVEREAEYCAPLDVPEDVQLRWEEFPVQLPREAGEKAFSLEETLELPPSAPGMERLICTQTHMQITEQKIVADKLIFRGIALVHILYQGTDGGQYGWDFEVPFSQYSELDNLYDADAQATLWPGVTAMETEEQSGQIRWKAGLLCQYRICDRPVIRVVTDAYSPKRQLQLQRTELELPAILESRSQTLPLQVTGQKEGLRMAQALYIPQPPQTHPAEDTLHLELPGAFQGLYYDMDGVLRETTMHTDGKLELPLDTRCPVEVTLWPWGKTQGSLMGGNMQMQTEVMVCTDTLLAEGISMVTGLELGELRQPDPNRPSLILCRMGEKSLWELAKTCDSTVEAIRCANRLEAEPTPEQMLLIPVKS